MGLQGFRLSMSIRILKCRLLSAFKDKSGWGVLCNTSLNFNGAGFINRMSDLADYVKSRSLDGFVVGDRFFKLL